MGPRNKEIIDRMYKMIEKDYMIVIYPEGQKEKDINEMIINGKTKEQVQKIISDNTYSSFISNYTNQFIQTLLRGGKNGNRVY